MIAPDDLAGVLFRNSSQGRAMPDRSAGEANIDDLLARLRGLGHSPRILHWRQRYEHASQLSLEEAWQDFREALLRDPTPQDHGLLAEMARSAKELLRDLINAKPPNTLIPVAQADAAPVGEPSSRLLGRPPSEKPRVIPFDFEIAFAKLPPDELPQSPELLREIVRTLLVRPSRSQHNSKKWCIMLRALAALEQIERGTPYPTGSPLYRVKCQGMPQQQAQKWKARILNELKAGQPSRIKHLVMILDLQKWILREYLEAENYPQVIKLGPQIWFQKGEYHEDIEGQRFLRKGRLDYISKRLRVLPCLCDYPSSLDGAVTQKNELDGFGIEDRKRGGYHSAPMMVAIYRILAHLHGTTEQQIRSMLKQTPRRSSFLAPPID